MTRYINQSDNFHHYLREVYKFVPFVGTLGTPYINIPYDIFTYQAIQLVKSHYNDHIASIIDRRLPYRDENVYNYLTTLAVLHHNIIKPEILAYSQ